MMVMTSNSQRRSPGSILREVKFILLLPSNWRVETMGEGDHESADCCRMEEVEGVGTVELVCVGRLLRMGCDSFVMPLCGSVGSGEPGSRMGYHGNILLRTNGGRRGRNRKPDFVAFSAQIVSGWVVVAWGTESYSGLAGNIFCIPGFEHISVGMGQTARLDKRNILCCNFHFSENLFLVGFMIFYFYLLFIILYVLNFFRIVLESLLLTQ